MRLHLVRVVSLAIAGLATAASAAEDSGLKLPEGFSAVVVNEGQGTARHLAIRANGDIYLAGRNGLLVSSGSDSHWPNHPVNPIAHHARWVAPLLDRLGYAVEPWEGPAWMPAPPPPADGHANATTTST